MAVLLPNPVRWQKFLMITSEIWFKQITLWIHRILQPTYRRSVKLLADRDTLVTFNFMPVSSSYVSTILHNLDSKKAVGVDCISSCLLHLSAPSIVNEITWLIHFFVNSQFWPQEWKCSIVAPVFKKDKDTKLTIVPSQFWLLCSKCMRELCTINYNMPFKVICHRICQDF